MVREIRFQSGVSENGNHGLDVELPLLAVVDRTEILVVVELKGDADQGRDRVGELLGERFLALLCQGRLLEEIAPCQHERHHGADSCL